MSLLVLLLIVNMFFGAILTYRSEKVNLKEFIISSFIVWILVLGSYGIWYRFKVGDKYYINDEIIELKYIPEYKYIGTCSRPCNCSKKGCSVCSYPCEKIDGNLHYYKRKKEKNYISISKENFNKLNENFELSHKNKGDRPLSMISGDKYDYFYKPRKDLIIPWTERKYYKNKVALTENIIKGRILKEDDVKPYPIEYSLTKINKVVGNINIDSYIINKINSKLDKANIIVYGITKDDKENCEEVKANWLNGKQNDLVFCITSKDNKTIESIKVFGWTKNEVLKKELELFLLNKDLNVFDKEIDYIIDKINSEFIELNMDDYNYLSINISGWDWVLLIFLYLLFSTTSWLVCYFNDYDDGDL